MKKYLVVFYLDVVASCEVEAENPAEARAIAINEDWSYDDEDVYETECHEIAEDEDDVSLPYTNSIFDPPDIEGLEVRRLLEEPFDAKKNVESGVFTFESLGGLVKGHCK
jgi:hypothetical protein